MELLRYISISQSLYISMFSIWQWPMLLGIQQICITSKNRTPAAPSRHLRRATIGTVWPAHGLTRQLCARSDGHKLPRQAGNGRALPGRNSVSAAIFRPHHFAALRFAARKQSALTPNYRQWADTTAISLRARLRCSPCCPCRTSPDATLMASAARTEESA